jgi:hypothetical protein
MCNMCRVVGDCCSDHCPEPYTAGMSNRGSPEGHMGHICVVMRATHDIAGRMFDMPNMEYVFFIQNVFNTWK